MKRFLTVLLSLVIVVSIIPSATFAAPLSASIPPGATYYNVRNYNELRAARDTIQGSSAPAVAVIRILADIEYPYAGAITFSHRNLHIVPGPGNYSITTANGTGFVISSPGNITFSGGTEGGRLQLLGTNNYGTAMQVRGGDVTLLQGASITNYPESGVQVMGGRFILAGGRIHHNRFNKSAGNAAASGGGGVRVTSGTFEMTSGTIEFNTAVNGGGVSVDNGGIFNMQGGQIRNNFSINHTSYGIEYLGGGGGLYVPASNLGNISIGENAVFLNNVAESGIRINNDLAEEYRHKINPGTVTITDLHLYLTEEGTYGNIMPHAFTNYDINTDGNLPRLWRVTYQGADSNGKVMARFGTSEIEIPSGFFVPEGTSVIFMPEPVALLNRWEVGTRLTETDEDGKEVSYQPVEAPTDTPLSLIITEHTRVIGHFSQGFTITKDPNGGQGEAFTQVVAAGPHTLQRQAEHDESSFRFMGWSTTPDESGILYSIGDSIEITEDITLYARWELGTASIMVAKVVTGDMGNRVMDFEFTIFFQDAKEEPLSGPISFNYTGGLLLDSGVTAPADGMLTLDNNGSATFKLKHGQAIRIEDIPIGGHVQVMEAIDDNYSTSYVTNAGDGGDVVTENVVIGNDTGAQFMISDLAIGCVNDRRYVPPTDIGSDRYEAMLLLLALASLPALGLLFYERNFKKVKM